MPDRSTSVRPALRRARGGLVLVAAVLLLAAGAGSAAALPQARATASKDLVTFGLGPSDGAKVDGRPYYYYAAAPGATITDHVVLVNYSRTPLPLTVYATDGYNTYSGSSSLLEQGKTPTDIGSWTRLRLRTKTVTVPGRRSETQPPGTLVVPFTVTVPAKAEPGDHVGGIVASLRTKGRNAQGYEVDLDQRVATQVFMRVAGALHPQLQVTDLRAHYVPSWVPWRAGSVRLSWTVRNTGNVRLGGRQRAAVSGLWGSWAAAGLADIPSLVPGGSAHVSTTVRGVWPEVSMRGTVRVTGLKLAADVNPPSRVAVAGVRFWVIPWLLLGAALLLGLLVLLRRLLRRRGGGLQAGAPPAGPAPVRPTVTAVPEQQEAATGWPAQVQR